MVGISGRARHFVLKIGNRKANYEFFKNVLKMNILRHEEFEKGCEAMCNGPYDGKWSKTMVGYGPEDEHFVVELTYNYTVKSYRLGNDLKGLTIRSDEVLASVRAGTYPKEVQEDSLLLRSPDGYKVFIKPGPGKLLVEVSLSVTNLAKSLDYWSKLLQMTVREKGDDFAVLTFGNGQADVRLEQVPSVDHAEAFGRTAFSTPGSQVQEIEKMMSEKGQTIITPYVSLDTPGKATVQVVILGDPDGHEICIVDDEGFRDLSKAEDDADEKIQKQIADDWSDDWAKSNP